MAGKTVINLRHVLFQLEQSSWGLRNKTDEELAEWLADPELVTKIWKADAVTFTPVALDFLEHLQHLPR